MKNAGGWFWVLAIVVLFCNSARLFAADEGLRSRWIPQPGGGDIKDISGNGYDMYPGYHSPGHIPVRGNGFLDLDGLGDYALISGNIKPVDYPGLTIMAWVYPHGQPVSKRSELLAQDMFADLGLTDKWCPSGMVYVNKTWQYAATDKAVTLDKWNHLAMTYDQQNLAFYLDGTAIGKSAAKGALVSNQRTAYLGASCSDENFYFCGLIGTVEIYSRALSPEEIAGRMKETKPGDLPAGYKLKADQVDQPLIFNGGFEPLNLETFSIAGGWRSNVWGENKSVFSEETENVHSGKACQKIEITSFTDGGVVLCQRNVGPVLKADTRYKLEVWLKGNEGIGEVTVWLRDKDWKDAPAFPNFRKTFPVTTEWKKYSVISEIKQDVIGNLAVSVHPQQAGILWVDDLTLTAMPSQ